MARQHNVTSTTYPNLVIDSGAVYKDYGEGSQERLGATRGGNVFSVETEYRDMEADGARGPVKGSRRITGVTAMITVNFLELDLVLIKRILTGSTSASVPPHNVVTRSVALTDAAYFTNIAIVGEEADSTNPVICKVTNAIVDGNLEQAFNDKDEQVIAVQFKGHFLPTDLDTEPWSISWPTS